jgi:hypothetical protein
MVFVPLAIAWWLTPLGLGFAKWPDGGIGSALKFWYLGSLFVGTPLMLMCWLLSPVAALFKRLSLALWAPGAAFALFLLLALPILIIL